MKDLSEGKGGKFVKTAKLIQENHDLKKENKELQYKNQMNLYHSQEMEARWKRDSSTKGSADWKSYDNWYKSEIEFQRTERMLHDRNERERKAKESKQKTIGKKD